MISKVAIVHKPASLEAEKISKEIEEYLKLKNIHIECKELNNFDYIDESQADLVIVIGGDGTIIRASHKVNDVPILGIKVGTLGFLCETNPQNAKSVISKILTGEYYFDIRSMLDVKYMDKSYSVLNEALIISSVPSKIIYLSLSKDGIIIHKGRADGIIISTSTGASAYALSAGGAIIDPWMDIIEVVFICPFSIALRPFIFPLSSKIEITLHNHDLHGKLILDGDEVCMILDEKPVFIEKSKKQVKFIRTEPYNFYERIKDKMIL